MSPFSSEKPCQVEQLDRILLSGVYNVRKGKTQLHKWAERSVTLCGTCLIVSSVKDSHAGKMHILPLVGGKVRLVFWLVPCSLGRKKCSSGGNCPQEINVGFFNRLLR